MRRWIGLLGLALFVPSESADAQGLVIRSSGPSAKEYPVGRMLPDGFGFVLRAGDRLTLLEKASTRVFKGPVSTKVGADSILPSSDWLARFAAFRDYPAYKRPRLAAGFCLGCNERYRRLEIGTLDVRRDAQSFCAIGPAGPRLTNASLRTTIRTTRGRRAHALAMEASGSAAWPAALPLIDNGEYVVIDGPKSTRFRLRRIPDATDLVELAMKLDDAGCADQATAVVLQGKLEERKVP